MPCPAPFLVLTRIMKTMALLKCGILLLRIEIRILFIFLTFTIDLNHSVFHFHVLLRAKYPRHHEQSITTNITLSMRVAIFSHIDIIVQFKKSFQIRGLVLHCLRLVLEIRCIPF